VTGGVSAIKGFDYQATVILDRLFDHFAGHGPTARVHPESLDDLDLTWEDAGVPRCQHTQVKKPREDNDGNPAPRPWSLREVTEQLLPGTLRNLRGNEKTQVWVLGDDVEPDVEAMIAAGRDAPITAAQAYWSSVHGLARPIVWTPIEEAVRKRLRGWPVGDATSALAEQSSKASATLEAAGVGSDLIASYLTALADIHGALPDILSRISVDCSFGAEAEIKERVLARLEDELHLSREIVEQTLFRNLRGFISDLSKQINRSFDYDEFHLELHSVWPRMSPVREPLALDRNHVARPGVIAQLLPGPGQRVTEVTGISGSGKTTLAAEAMARVRADNPERLVAYAEVRLDVSFRDVLAGAAFHLRRHGLPDLFPIAVGRGASDEAAIRRLAQAFSSLPRDVLLIVDAVDGQVVPGFGRDLAVFVRCLTSTRCQLVVLGHERILDGMAAYDRDLAGVTALDVPGFGLEEFIALAKRFHPTIERSPLFEIHLRLSAGREAGVSALLARLVASANSLDEMDTISKRSADEMLTAAETLRFAKVSAGARPAAERLLMFALPFRRQDAEAVFPSFHVGAAIRELQGLGLLRSQDDRHEMHETIRAGLESTLSVELRREANYALGNYYAATGMLTEEIFHRDRAGEGPRAKGLARAAFLRGEKWDPLAAYIVEHQLVTAEELVETVRAHHKIDAVHLLPNLLKSLGGIPHTVALVDLFRRDPAALLSEFNRGLAVVEAILDAEPAYLRDLIEILLNQVSDADRRESLFGVLAIARRRSGRHLDTATLAFIVAQPPPIRRAMAGLLAQDGRRDALRALFTLIEEDQEGHGRARRTRQGLSVQIHLETTADVVEVLAALPAASNAEMLATASPRLGALANLLWAIKSQLAQHAPDIARDADQPPPIVGNALRVLAFLGDPALPSICQTLEVGQGEAAICARLMPAIVPAFFDDAPLMAKVSDVTAESGARAMAVKVLIARGCDPDDLRAHVEALPGDPISAAAWDLLFLLSALAHPTPGSLQLLRAALTWQPRPPPSVLAALLVSHAELVDAGATALFSELIADPDLQVRQAAIVHLPLRRARSALPAIIRQWGLETDVELRVLLLRAALACGASSTAAFADGASRDLDFWRSLLARRSRDAAFGPELVRLATNDRLPWALRRTAIFAAGRLPFEAALDRIAPAVLQARSPLPSDDGELHLHQAIVAILSTGILAHDGLLPVDRAGFEATLTDFVQAYWQHGMGAPPAETTRQGVAWLYDHVTAFSGMPAAHLTEHTIDLLSLPLLQSAVLRAYQWAGRDDLVEAQLRSTDNEWLAVKCILTLARAHSAEPGFSERMASIVAASPCQTGDLLRRVIANFRGRTAAKPASQALAKHSTEPTPPFRPMGFDEVLAYLSGVAAEIPAGPPLVMEGLTEGQCARLIALADPRGDPPRQEERYVAGVAFLRAGHQVARRQVTSTGGSETGRDLIRAAVAAANGWGLSNRWHDDLLHGPYGRNYVEQFLVALAARGDPDRAFAALRQDEDILFPAMCLPGAASRIGGVMDERIIPYLQRNLASGTDEMLAGLCTLASGINVAAIVPVLDALLTRWCRRFDPKAQADQHTENHVLWQTFTTLSRHARFRDLPDWRGRLETVLRGRLRWFHADSLVRLLELDPRSYVLIEQRGQFAEDWGHYLVDEIDRLDEAAERLFPQLVEP
jgi:RecA/RadA recombinase